MLWTDKQTNKQTDSKILPTPTDVVGVGNYSLCPFLPVSVTVVRLGVYVRDSLVSAELAVTPLSLSIVLQYRLVN